MQLIFIILCTITLGTVVWLFPNKHQFFENPAKTRKDQDIKIIGVRVGSAMLLCYSVIFDGGWFIILYSILYYTLAFLMIVNLQDWGKKFSQLMEKPISQPASQKWFLLLFWMLVCWGGYVSTMFWGGISLQTSSFPMLVHAFAMGFILIGFVVCHIFVLSNGLKTLEWLVVGFQAFALSGLVFYSFTTHFAKGVEEPLHDPIEVFAIGTILTVAYVGLNEIVSMRQKNDVH